MRVALFLEGIKRACLFNNSGGDVSLRLSPVYGLRGNSEGEGGSWGAPSFCFYIRCNNGL